MPGDGACGMDAGLGTVDQECNGIGSLIDDGGKSRERGRRKERTGGDELRPYKNKLNAKMAP
jgi:hypothetical protein